MEKFNEVSREVPQDNKNTCVPMAISIVTGKPFAEINDEMIERGLRTKTKGSPAHKWIPYLEEKVQLNDRTSEIKELGGSTVNNVAQVVDSSKKYIMCVAGHALAYSDGSVQDWSIDRQLRIKRVWEIVDGEPGQLSCVLSANDRKLLAFMATLDADARFEGLETNKSGPDIRITSFKYGDDTTPVYVAPRRGARVRVTIMNGAWYDCYDSDEFVEKWGKPTARKHYVFWEMGFNAFADSIGELIGEGE